MVDSSLPAEGRNKVELHSGSVVGEYRLEELIETGEAGQVFLARHITSKVPFRLRILTAPSQLDAAARMLYLGYFQKQANQLAALQHAHILPLLSYSAYQGMPYLAYQQYPMVSLSKHLAQYGPLDAQRAGFYLDQIAAALECGQQHGTLHRNLSTECIFVKQDGNLVVADFGVLHMLEQGGEYSGDHATVAQHDPAFGMNEASSPAPEQVTGGAIDTTVDVYALGAVLYRMLTGHRVFRGKTRQEIAQQHLNAPVPPLNTWRHDLPSALDGVIARAMAKEPRQRFARPGELANAYHQLVAPQDSKRQPFAAAPAPALNPLAKAQPANSMRKSAQAPIPRRKVLTFLVAGGGAAAAITVVSIVGIHSLQGNNAGITSTTTGSKTPGSTHGSTPASSGRPTPASSQGKVLAHVSDVPLNSDKTFPLTSSSNPGLLIHLPDNRFVAFDSTCTHAGCAVNYNAQNKLLECPC
ncbi:MAG TPA: protein kinase, partial [Ktedonobacteraceae bacterium]|nr:protein kinase [Ktedonobacteraceae bacterium]